MNPPTDTPANRGHDSITANRAAPHEPRWFHRLGGFLIFAVIRTVAATLRYRWNDRSGYFEHPPADPAIYCVWHNRLALCQIAYGYPKKRNHTPGMAAMVSASK